MAEGGVTFQFDPAGTPTPTQLTPLYTAILSAGPRPNVDLGSEHDAALAWLDRAGAVYIAAVGKRSSLIRGMVLRDRVDLVGLAEE